MSALHLLDHDLRCPLGRADRGEDRDECVCRDLAVVDRRPEPGTASTEQQPPAVA